MYEFVTKEDLTPCHKVLRGARPRCGAQSSGRAVRHRSRARQGERSPLTIADYDRQRGTLTLVVQEVGKTTMLMGAMRAGSALALLRQARERAAFRRAAEASPEERQRAVALLRALPHASQLRYDPHMHPPARSGDR